MKWKIPKFILAPALVLAALAGLGAIMAAFVGLMLVMEFFFDDPATQGIAFALTLVFIMGTVVVYSMLED